MIIKSKDWHPSKSTKNFAVICPFHYELTPSCIVMPMKGTFHCFGCGKEGFIGDDDCLFTEEYPSCE